MKWAERLQWFLANPLTWVLWGALLLAEYGNWHLGRTLDRVCELTGDHPMAVANPKTDREELDNICTGRSLDDEAQNDPPLEERCKWWSC